MIKIKLNLKKITAVVLVSVMFALNISFAAPAALAETETTTTSSTTSTPEAPSAPSAPSTPTAPSAPSTPSAPSAPKTPSAPSAPSTPTAPSAPSTPSAPSAPSAPSNPSEPVPTTEPPVAPVASNNENPQNEASQGSGSGNVGDTLVTTGDATNDAQITTTGNNNASATQTPSGGSTKVTNSSNGAGSTNTSGSTNTTNNTTTQNNNAAVNNDLSLDTDTGNNNTSFNVGESVVLTGDANTSGTVVTAVNTNVDGIAVAEFNIVDDHNGDIILDFGNVCTSNCWGNTSVENSGNGSFSHNEAQADTVVNNTTDQTNNANVGNNLDLAANSGNNDASFNTGGDSTIVTGDANVSANVLTFANNNIAGNVIYGVVNIFGDLVGNIILTQEALDALCGGPCGGNTQVANTGNGADSTNVASAQNNTNNTVNQSNDAQINNTLVLDSNTGGNDANFNTGGNSVIQTGDTSIDVNVVNIANLNLTGGTFWLVIVNEAGNWIGRILGAPSGSNVAASPIMEVVVDPITGAVSATNSDNGANSNNTANASQTTNNEINQTNNAVVNNQINLSANTGNNTANFNTGGDSTVVTGDANIVANIVNFVNNNIVGDGMLFVSLINVFGSWIGDFITPGASAADNDNNNGGNDNPSPEEDSSSTPTPPSNSGNSGSGSSSGGSSSSNSNSSSSNSSSVPQVLATTSYKNSFQDYGYGRGGLLASGVSDETPESSFVSEAQAAESDGGSSTSINLAWALLLLPAYLIIRIARRRLSA